jgi:hypothetical protein
LNTPKLVQYFLDLVFANTEPYSHDSSVGQTCYELFVTTIPRLPKQRITTLIWNSSKAIIPPWVQAKQQPTSQSLLLFIIKRCAKNSQQDSN